MSEHDQTFVPESFIDLYRDRSRRLTTTRAELAARYDLCEDMATLLVDRCQAMQARETPQAEVMAQCLAGLLAAPEAVCPPEAYWVVRRSAELLGWAWEAPAAA